MLTIGVIGLGQMGMLHLMNSLHIDNVKVVAVADRSKKALNRANSLGVKKLFSNYCELLTNCQDLDAVIISLPTFLHFESVKLALENRMNVFVEKPLAKTTQECKEIVKLTEKSGKKLMVGHVMRFFDSIEKMKEIIDKGHIGSPEVITAERVGSGPFSHGIVPKPVPEWWFDPEKTGGGALIDLGYHLIDLFRFFTGDCQLLYSHLDYKFNLPLEDTAIVMLKSIGSSTKGIVHTGWYEKLNFPQYDFRVIIHGDSGFTSTRHFEPRHVYFYAAKEGMKNLLRKIAGKEIKRLAYSYYFAPYYTELKHFFNCVENDFEPRVLAIDGLKTVEIIEEAYRLAK